MFHLLMFSVELAMLTLDVVSSVDSLSTVSVILSDGVNVLLCDDVLFASGCSIGMVVSSDGVNVSLLKILVLAS